jgi:lysophospholipase L1-like esterase
MKRIGWLITTIISLAFCSIAAVAQVGNPDKSVAASLFSKPGARLAVCGDSITEQHFYSRFIELYFTACMPDLKVRQCHWGMGGDTARKFSSRMENSLREFQPTVVTFCFGMNDGLYKEFDPAVGKIYGDSMRGMVNSLAAKGTTVFVGGPGVVDSRYYTRTAGKNPAGIYNQTLGQLDAIAKAVADEAKMPHIPVHDTMMEAMAKAKAALGADYPVAGRDGIHPQLNGHVIMAYAFLKAMGMNGDLGTITVDLKGTSTATGGHKVLSDTEGKVEVESSRYPFCFTGDEKSPDGTRSMLPFVPFNQDLNRLTLVVRNLGADHGQVTWGVVSKTFTRQELEKGINLAAVFPDNPFSGPFDKLDKEIFQKQVFERGLMWALNDMPMMQEGMASDAEGLAALESVRKAIWENQVEYEKRVQAAFVPVKHVLVVQPAL